MNTKLWELSDDIEMLSDTISQIEQTPDLSDEDRESLLNTAFKQWLETAQDFEDKALNVASYIRHLEAVTKARKDEVKRLQQLAKQSENQANRLRGYLTYHMRASDKNKIEGPSGKLSLRKKPPQLKILCDVEDLPEEFTKVTIAPDKTKLKDYIKQNGDLTFALLDDDNDYSLTIK